MYPDQQQQLEQDNHYADFASLPLDFSEFLNQDTTVQNDFSTDSATFVSGSTFDFDFDAVLAPTTANTSCDSFPSTTNFSSFEFSSNSTTATTTLQDLSPSTESAPFADPSYHHHQDAWHGITHPTPPPSVTATVRSSKTTSPNLPQAKPAPVSPVISDSPEEAGDLRKRKRERNTEAARRYRQRRQDRLEELEEALAAMTKDRDGLRIKLARSEAEADVLRGLVGKK